MLKKLISLFNSFFKIGIIGFGGGSALIPVVEKEIVEDKKWFNEEAYLKHTVIANITPGTLPVKLGAIAGYERAGGIGSIIGAYAGALPGVGLTILFLALFAIIGEKLAHYIEFASVGISLFIINLLLIYILKVIKSGEKEGIKKQYLIICLTAFLVTGGKEIRQLLAMFIGRDLGKFNFILFDISTINLIILSFFMILFTGLMATKGAMYIGIILSFAFAFINGKNHLVSQSDIFSNFLLGIMAILTCYAIIKEAKQETSKKQSKFQVSKEAYIAIGLFLGISITLFILVLLFTPSNSGIGSFAGNIVVSTVTSFGGGEAYVSVADGMFVQTEMISAGDFYNKLVAIANALPGPILVKIAAGVGFILGENLGGLSYGLLLATLAMSIAVGSCCILSIVVLLGYDSLKHSRALIMIKKYILPVVCGMLISTSLSMLVECMKVTQKLNISGFIALPSMILAIGGIYFLHKKYRLNDLVLLLGSAGLSLILFQLF
jgi:chromate transporter